MIHGALHKNKVILIYGRFSEKIDDVSIIDIPLCNPSNEGNWMGWTKYLQTTTNKMPKI